MLIPPDGLPEATLRPALERRWGIRAASVRYRAVGWGSHHWEVCAADGARWFVTADELENKRLSQAETLAGGFRRLHAALSAASDLRDCGAAFVVAAGARPGRRAGRAGRRPVRRRGLPVRRGAELRVGGVLLARAPAGRARPDRRHAHARRPRPAGGPWRTTSASRTGTNWRPPASPGAAPGTPGPYAHPAARLIQRARRAHRSGSSAATTTWWRPPAPSRPGLS